jgi:hypothetical protein
MWGSASLDEAAVAAGLMASDPFIARRSRDPVPLAELGHRPLTTREILHKLQPLVRNIRFHPRHLPGVNDVPGLVLTMNPVYTVAPPNTTLQPTSGAVTDVARSIRGVASDRPLCDRVGALRRATISPRSLLSVRR